MKNVASSFRGEVKKAALPICMEHYKLEPKYYEKDPGLDLLAGGGDLRVKDAAERAIKGSAYLDGPTDDRVSCFLVSYSR